MAPRTLRAWVSVHKWTSLACTLFMLLLCLTGLPLLFHHEISHWLGTAVEAPVMPANTPRADLDQVLDAALALHPGKVVQFIFRERDDEDRWFVSLGDTPTAAENLKSVVIDARTGAVLGQPRVDEGFLYMVHKLHLDMFAGLPGTLFLGFMGLLFALALVSGVVLYAPFMRKLEFGTVRRDRSARMKWLDLHNLIGIATLAWALVVGLTGVVNTLTLPALDYWRVNDLPRFVAQYTHDPAPQRLGSMQKAVASALAHAPGMTVSFVAFPGGIVSTDHHYAVFMRGDSPLTARLLTPVLVDARTSEVTASAPLPWYLTVLLISQPLHFGDYGGLPLRIIWALLDLATISVLLTGLYLWLDKSGKARTRARSILPGADVPTDDLT